MTMPSSGPLNMGGTSSPVSVAQELGLSLTATISMNDSNVRTLAGVGGSGTSWSMSSLYGKSNQFTFTISANQTNADLRTLAINAGWNQSTRVVATINSGVYISSNSTGTPALTISGSFPNGVQLVNNGFIVGMGGNGGKGADIVGQVNAPGSPGSAGGGALLVQTGVTITNNGTIGGGGGGGGGATAAQYYSKPFTITVAGSGGGGGRSSAAANSSGGAGGSKGNFGAAFNGNAGAAGTVSGPGGSTPPSGGAAGGTGGGWGASGATGGGANGTPGSGGGGGYAVSGNSNVTWAATGTRLGSIS